MFIKIKRQDCLIQYPKFPLTWFDKANDDIIHSYPKVFTSFILTLPSKSFKGHSKLLGVELTLLVKALHFNSIIFLGEFDTPWLKQTNDYKPVKEALQFLKDHKVSKQFDGALQVSIETLPLFIKHISWLSRCNGALPNFYFTDAGQNIIGCICKYGNVHLDIVNKKTVPIIKDLVAASKFNYLTGKICDDQFSKSGAIRGRRIKMQ